MICQAHTKKPSSGSTNWLDRLRSARGFPSTDGVDFDRFIAAQSSDSSAANSKPIPNSTRRYSTHFRRETPSKPTAKQSSIDRSRDNKNEAQCSDDEDEDVEEEEGGVGRVLCELFVMGPGDDQPGGGITGNLGMNKKKKKKKNNKNNRNSRKQQNPRFCDARSNGAYNGVDCALDGLLGTSKARGEEDNKTRINGFLSNNHNNSPNDRTKGSQPAQIDVEESGLRAANNEDEGEELDVHDKDDLKRYSMSEVTVIDSSIQGWKVERCVYRRKNVWRVLGKKGKKRSTTAKRKRRLTASNWGSDDSSDEEDVNKSKRENEKKKKKMKQKKKQELLAAGSDGGLGGANPLQNGNGEQLGPLIDDRPWHDVPKEAAPVPRFTSLSSSQNLGRAGSSVILVKAIPQLDNGGVKKAGKIIKKG